MYEQFDNYLEFIFCRDQHFRQFICTSISSTQFQIYRFVVSDLSRWTTTQAGDTFLIYMYLCSINNDCTVAWIIKQFRKNGGLLEASTRRTKSHKPRLYLRKAYSLSTDDQHCNPFFHISMCQRIDWICTSCFFVSNYTLLCHLAQRGGICDRFLQSWQPPPNATAAACQRCGMICNTLRNANPYTIPHKPQTARSTTFGRV